MHSPHFSVLNLVTVLLPTHASLGCLQKSEVCVFRKFRSGLPFSSFSGVPGWRPSGSERFRTTCQLLHGRQLSSNAFVSLHAATCRRCEYLGGTESCGRSANLIHDRRLKTVDERSLDVKLLSAVDLT